jgi:hypothetical protein
MKNKLEARQCITMESLNTRKHIGRGRVIQQLALMAWEQIAPMKDKTEWDRVEVIVRLVGNENPPTPGEGQGEQGE